MKRFLKISAVLIQVVVVLALAYYYQQIFLSIVITYLFFKETYNYYKNQPKYVKKVTYLNGSSKKFTREDWEMLKDKIEVMEGIKIKDI
jgi:uncharacterized membrane protein YdbT with pleckstrin-like domain